MSLSTADVAMPGDGPSDPQVLTPQVRGTPLRAMDLPGLHDFWAVYERHHDEIRAILMAELKDDQEVGEIMRKTPREILDQRSIESRELTKRAVSDGAWEPYLEHLRQQGAMYANMGLSFAAWFRIIGAFRPHVVRHLLAAFAADTQRLTRAIDAMDHLIDLALSTIGDAYLASQEELIARQREAIGELRSRARYQVILASIADGVVTTDPHGNIVTINPAMERIGGVKAENAVGRRYEETFRMHEGDRPLAWEERHLYRAISEQAVVHSGGEDLRLQRPDGSEALVSVTSAPVVEEGGYVSGGVNVIRERHPSPTG